MIMRWCHLDGLSVNFTQTFLLKNKGFPSKQLSLAHSFLGCSQSLSIKVLCWALLWDRIWNKAGLGCWGSLEFLQYVCDYIFFRYSTLRYVTGFLQPSSDMSWTGEFMHFFEIQALSWAKLHSKRCSADDFYIMTLAAAQLNGFRH